MTEKEATKKELKKQITSLKRALTNTQKDLVAAQRQNRLLKDPAMERILKAIESGGALQAPGGSIEVPAKEVPVKRGIFGWCKR